MDEQEFYQIVAEKLQERLRAEGKEVSTWVDNIVKFNDQKYPVISVWSSEDKVTPCFHLEDCYKRFSHGIEMGRILNFLTATYYKSVADADRAGESILDDKQLRESLSITIADPECNKEWLSGKIYEPIGPFVKVCYFQQGIGDEYSELKYPDFDYCKRLGITKHQLIAEAEKRQGQEEATLMSMSQMAAQFLTDSKPVNLLWNPTDKPICKGILKQKDGPLFVLANPKHYLGAAMITRSDLMRQIGEMFDEDFYILPSSIHEVILLPCSCRLSVERLSEMVKGINESEVEIGDRLSNRIIYYDRERGQLKDVMERPHNPEIEEKPETREERYSYRHKRDEHER